MAMLKWLPKVGAFLLLLVWAVVSVEYGTNTGTLTIEPHVPEPSPVAMMIAKHHCWSGEGPAGVIPGHAVVTMPNGELRYVGHKLTGWALDQLPKEVTGKAPVDHGLEVHAFCR